MPTAPRRALALDRDAGRKPSGMTFSGDLSGISLPDVFQNLAGNRSTGTLHIRWDKGERFVRFVDGQVAGVSHGQGKELPLLDHVAERGYADGQAVARLLANRRR